METANFFDMCKYGDIITSKKFEGIDMKWQFTEQQYDEMDKLQPILLGILQGEDLALYVSKLFDRPFGVLDYKVGRILGEIKKPVQVLENMKVMMYDGHDTQCVNILNWLHPTNLEYPKPTQFATEISIELQYSDICLKQTSGASKRDCIKVKWLFNGEALEFAG